MKPLSQPRPTEHEILGRATDRQTRKKQRAEAILRDLAFVLKMTQQVRAEIDTEKESEAFAIA